MKTDDGKERGKEEQEKLHLEGKGFGRIKEHSKCKRQK